MLAWLREFESSATVSSHVVLWGNVTDRLIVGDPAKPTKLHDALWDVYQRLGFDALLYADIVDGCSVVGQRSESPLEGATVSHSGAYQKSQLGQLLSELSGGSIQITDGTEARPAKVALIVGYASRLVLNPTALAQDEHEFFTAALKRANEARPLAQSGGSASFNQVVWLTEGERDLPLWFTTGNESVRSIAVPSPDLAQRIRAAELIRPSDDPEQFAEQAEGLTINAMLKTGVIAHQEGLSGGEIDEAVRLYRYGFSDNPWKSPERLQRIRKGETVLNSRVLGQKRAVRKALDTLMRSAANMSGSRSKPRGVLFFAGPTGVGKTELAKALTELIFGSEDAYLRFDMSEYSAEHSEARFIGSPPGYVGFDAGGQLTNGVRQKPFSLVLFDEIDKAHPSILDKFLQILEDGRLTDGAGSTVNFSECILVFTTNLGIRNNDGSVIVDYAMRVDQGFDEIEKKVTGAIAAFFHGIKRPELLNRFGRNITVFDFITPEVAEAIFGAKLEAVSKRSMDEHGVDISFADAARQHLLEVARSTPDDGGRGCLTGWRTRSRIHCPEGSSNGWPAARQVQKLGQLPS